MDEVEIDRIAKLILTLSNDEARTCMVLTSQVLDKMEHIFGEQFTEDDMLTTRISVQLTFLFSNGVLK